MRYSTNLLITFLAACYFFCFVKSSQVQQVKHQKQNTQFIFLFFTKQCFQKYFNDFDFFDGYCLEKTMIKVLSYGLIFGGMIIKLPQIIRIMADKSVFGISIWSVALESIGQLSIMIYSYHRGNPFSVYGQSIFMVIGNFFITILFFVFHPSGNKLLYFLNIVLILIAPYIMVNSDILPSEFYENCIFMQLALLSFARLNQIIHIFKHGSTGSLSFIMIFCQVVGNIGRFITICFDAANDWKFKMFVFSAFCLNTILLLQFFIFWGKKGDKNSFEKEDLIKDVKLKQK